MSSSRRLTYTFGTPLLIDVFHSNQWEYYFASAHRGKADSASRLTVHFKDDKVASFTGEGRSGPAPVGSSSESPRR